MIAAIMGEPTCHIDADAAVVAPPAEAVVIIDDDRAVRDSLRWLIESVGLTTRTFTSAQDFLASYETLPAGVILLDVRMPGMSGLELQEHLRARGLDIPVILLTGHADVAMAVRAMKAGALDFIEKPFNDQQLLDRVQLAMQESKARSAARSARRDILHRLDKLSPRERAVMDLVVAGKSNKEIAVELGLSQKTVEVHRAHVMSKTRASSLAELVRLAVAAE